MQGQRFAHAPRPPVSRILPQRPIPRAGRINQDFLELDLVAIPAPKGGKLPSIAVCDQEALLSLPSAALGHHHRAGTRVVIRNQETSPLAFFNRLLGSHLL